MDKTIPLEAQKELLAVVKGWRHTLTALEGKTEKKLVAESDAFSFTISLFNAEDATLEPEYIEFKKLLNGLPYGKESLRDRLTHILNLVPQLKAACLTPFGLASALDTLLFNISEKPQFAELSKLPDDRLIAYLTDRFFEAPYSRMALIHIYNLKTDKPIIEIPYINARLLALTETDLPLITGEPTLTSTLHYPHAGNCFLVYEDSDYSETGEWLSKKWDEAWGFISILKYLNYSVVDIDYAARFFKPTWVNKVRRYGIDIMGRPRWDEQSHPYQLSDDMLPKLGVYMKAAKALQDRLSDFSSDLRRSIAFAGDRYEYHHTRMKLEDQLLELVIALEALFSPSHEGELRFRVSQGIAVLLGKDPSERAEIFQFVKKIYDERSAFVHGGKNPIQEGSVKPEDIARLGDYVREAILRFGTLYVRGENTRKAILDEILTGTLDFERAEALRRRSDTELFLQQGRFAYLGSGL